MGYISIYRKWRPQNFSEIVGQDDTVKTLKNAIKTSRLSHAYIFCGPRGTGKTSTARILAKAVNCKEREKDKNHIEPCNICENCISITNGTNVDVIEIDAASNRKVETARDLIEKVNYLPNYLKKKVYIIDEVHMLTDAAFNTLLKTLEEPPEHVMFILATTEPEKVLPTILSRCQRFNFKPISSDSITKKLKTISAKENIDISDAALSLISKYSGGSQRDANVILEKLASLDEDKIKVEDVAALLGAVDFEILFELTNILIENNISEALFFEHRLQESYQNLRIFVEEFLNHLHTLFIIKNYESAYEILNINAEYREKYSDQAKLITNNALHYYIDLFTDLYREIKISEGSKILFRSALIKAVIYNGNDNENKEANVFGSSDEKISVFDREIKDLNLKIIEIQRNLINISNELKEKYENINVNKFEKEELKQSAAVPLKVSSETEIKTGTKENKQAASENKESLKESGTSKGSANDIAAGKIISDWDRICKSLRSKEKGIPLYSQFVETRKLKINNDSILFYLPDNYKFHKESLNKPENLKKIEESIREVTGSLFKVNFFFEGEGKDLTDIKNLTGSMKKTSLSQDRIEEKGKVIEDIDKDEKIKTQIKKQYFKIKEANNQDSDFDYYVNPDEDKIEEYNYLEKKFGIKEKKSGD
ncbi:MAG: DNA polymerase III subunit gamma/tau [Actinobacteria bacterium]|nr:DNA polymerase III subunit gamma/tau [Actinomycetota bacterium]MCL6088272.1 DNA polymerase III subunit gamma/tau [Actinomycetota bacterium]